MSADADALAWAAMNALADTLAKQDVKGSGLQSTLLLIMRIAARLTAVIGVADQQIADEAADGVDRASAYNW
jgi:hypothetical protein